jgi:hypothetical protein
MTSNLTIFIPVQMVAKFTDCQWKKANQEEDGQLYV